MVKVKRGDIFLVNLNPTIGGEQNGIRPCLIIQNDFGNKLSPITIIAPITSKIFSKEYLTNVFLPKKNFGLDKDSTVLLNQIKSIDKIRIIKKIGKLDLYYMGLVDSAVKISLGLE